MDLIFHFLKVSVLRCILNLLVVLEGDINGEHNLKSDFQIIGNLTIVCSHMENHESQWFQLRNAPMPVSIVCSLSLKWPLIGKPSDWAFLPSKAFEDPVAPRLEGKVWLRPNCSSSRSQGQLPSLKEAKEGPVRLGLGLVRDLTRCVLMLLIPGQQHLVNNNG